MKIKYLAILASSVMSFSQLLFSLQVTEKKGVFQYNWSNSTVRYIGPMRQANNFIEAEKKAYEDGHKEFAKLLTEKIAANEKVDRDIRPYQTHFFGSGEAKIEWEAPLALIFFDKTSKAKGETFTQADPSLTKGCVLALNQQTAPTAEYTVVNSKGETLFDISNVDKDAFYRRLMGRWYKDKKSKEIKDLIEDDNKNVLNLIVTSDDRFQVESDKAWSDFIQFPKNESCLKNALTYVVYP